LAARSRCRAAATWGGSSILGCVSAGIAELLRNELGEQRQPLSADCLAVERHLGEQRDHVCWRILIDGCL
jgi:hypothetical protein